MPKRQETFKLVPATLVTNTTPRRPMTSKEAKKAYREANKTPKLSRAEQRRIEAEETARQKKEHERERAAAKAKAAREKKQKKEAEEKEKRRKMGLPEPSRYVRPSQPTIKGFVRTGAGTKRSWEEMDSIVEEGAETGDKNSQHGNINHTDEGSLRNLNALQEAEDDDEFGDFPSLSQMVDLPSFPDVTNKEPYTGAATPAELAKHHESVQIDQRGSLFTIPDPPCRNQGNKSEDEMRQRNDSYHEERSPVSKCEMTQQDDDDDEFGDFPSLSQVDMPCVHDGMNSHWKGGKGHDDDASITVEESCRLAVSACPVHEKERALELFELVAELDEEMAIVEAVRELGENGAYEKMSKEKIALGQTLDSIIPGILADATNAQRTGQENQGGSFPRPSKTPYKPSQPFSAMKMVTEVSAKLSTRSATPQLPKTVDSRSMRTPSPPELPELPLTSNGSRKPLRELPGNMHLPPRPLVSKVIQPLSNVHGGTKFACSKNSERKQPASSLLSPSTLVFLETHLEDLFPSPSQQIRELVEEIDDIPSNTQVAREIELDRSVTKGLSPVPLLHLQAQSHSVEDHGLRLLSSQGFEISSQGLTETNTPSKAEPLNCRRVTSTDYDLGLAEIPNPPPSPELPRKRAKPRFFEEKEEDLIVAALHESLLMAKQQAHSSSPRRSQRIAQKVKDVKVEPSKDDYDSDDFETDSDLLAVLDDVESKALSSLRMKSG